MPQRIQDYRSGFNALDYSYTYDDNLQVTSLTDNVISSFSITNMAYDGLGRLTSTTGNAGIGSSTMRYDGLGNITYYKNKKHTLDYAYDTNNRLEFVLGTKPYDSFTYDARGNVTNNSHHAFTYNLANQMVASGSNSYTYDGFNRRVIAQEGTKTNYSVYSQSGQLLYTETAQGGVNYIYLGKKLIAKDGVVPQSSAKQHYMPYGGSIEGEKNDVGYTGHKFDTALNLSYMQARYYDPVIGRFYSNDPVGFMERDISTFNRYSYVGNDPINKNDPTGMFGYYPGFNELSAQFSNPAVTSAVIDFTPGVGDAKTIGEAIVSPSAINVTAAVVGMVPVVGDAGARIIKGTAQMTKKGGEATSHASTSERIANEMAESGEYATVHLNQTVTTITDGVQSSRVRPDVAGVRVDNKKVDVVEVLSPGQTAPQMETKINNALGSSCNRISCVSQD